MDLTKVRGEVTRYTFFKQAVHRLLVAQLKAERKEPLTHGLSHKETRRRRDASDRRASAYRSLRDKISEGYGPTAKGGIRPGRESGPMSFERVEELVANWEAQMDAVQDLRLMMGQP